MRSVRKSCLYSSALSGSGSCSLTPCDFETTVCCIAAGRVAGAMTSRKLSQIIPNFRFCRFKRIVMHPSALAMVLLPYLENQHGDTGANEKGAYDKTNQLTGRQKEEFLVYSQSPGIFPLTFLLYYCFKHQRRQTCFIFCSHHDVDQDCGAMSFLFEAVVGGTGWRATRLASVLLQLSECQMP